MKTRVLKQDSKTVVHSYFCSVAMCLDFFYEIIMQFTFVSELFSLLELFGWLFFFWGRGLWLQVDGFYSWDFLGGFGFF